eukprot:g20793.t1
MSERLRKENDEKVTKLTNAVTVLKEELAACRHDSLHSLGGRMKKLDLDFAEKNRNANLAQVQQEMRSSKMMTKIWEEWAAYKTSMEERLEDMITTRLGNGNGMKTGAG